MLGDSIARLTGPAGPAEWHFYIVDSKEVNAFAVPGGFIYVNRGLIERTQRMDQLAGVLGHEIGHVVRRHSIKQMQQQQGANIGVTLACVLTSVCNSQAGQAAIQVGGTALFAKFSRGDEKEADEEGVKNVDPRRHQPERHPGDVPDPASTSGSRTRGGGRLVRHAPARGGPHRRDAAR